MVRIKTVTHGEYEVIQCLLDSLAVAENLATLKYNLVPNGDAIAENRFNASVNSIAQLLNNMADRRLHRLPTNHPSYKGK
mgnify:CR=1 FL=1|tara:strand:- start:20214 stop:20453 length:240 start_codon:yes stop_codon:yes gene_type:complete